MQDVGERLLTSRTQHEPHVRARVIQECRNRVGHRTAVAFAVQRAKHTQGVANRLEPGRQRVRDSEGVKPARDVVVLEQLLIANREQRAAQSREDRELIVRPLDRHQRRAQRFDFVAIVERLAANQEMFDAARLERFDVRPCDVLTEADEAAKQDADVTRLERNPLIAFVALGDRPAALVHEPVDIRAHGIWQAALDLTRCDESLAVWFRHRQNDHRRLPGVILAIRFERDISGLVRVAIAVHQRFERRVHDMLDIGNAAETLAKLDWPGASFDEHFAHASIDIHVRAPEAINRLLRIADDEELAGDGSDVLPARLIRIISRQQQQ